MSLPVADTTRTNAACRSCRKRKIKCSGTRPCRNCQRQNLDCVFEGIVKRKSYPESYVNSLLHKIRQQDEQLEKHRNTAASERQVSGNIDHATINSELHFSLSGSDLQSSQPLSTAQDENPSFGENSSQSASSPATLHNPSDDVIRGPGLLPSRSFSSHVNQLLKKGGSTGRRYSVRREIDTKTYPLIPWSSFKASKRPELILPNRQKVHNIVEVFISAVGDGYHFFDQRLFCDRLESFYQSPMSMKNFDSLWHIEFLLVLALGMLLSGDIVTEMHPPGITYFLEARNLLPDISTLRSGPTEGVEILCLLSFYLQCCDQREDAYIYIGMAIRIAISNNICDDEQSSRALRSEITHRTRLWWTVYILDRCIAAAVGGPVGIADQDIEVELPSSSPGFPAPSALIVSVQIARATGNIISSLYHPKKFSGETIVSEVQAILNSLHETARLIPPEHAVDFNQSIFQISRTGASLYLMLFQAIILSIRPILFHLVRRRTREMRGDIPPPQKCPADLVRLTELCRNAATMSLEVLLALHRQNIISTFGFFDLDAAFSACFVFVIDGIISSPGQGARPSRIDDAYQIIQYLAGAGNEAAVKRATDIEQISAVIWPFASSTLQVPKRHLYQGLRENNPYEPFKVQPMQVPTAGIPHQHDPATSPSETITQATANPISTEIYPGRPINVSVNPQQQPMQLFHGANHNFQPLTLDPKLLTIDDTDLLDMYQDPDLLLTGVDLLDWVELERLINDFQENPVPS